MKKKKVLDLAESPAFPLDALKKIEEFVEEKKNRLSNMSVKEVELYCRLFPFTPNSELESRFNLAPHQRELLDNMLSDSGIMLRKDESYVYMPARREDGVKVREDTKNTPGYIVSRVMAAVSPEERDELALMYEQGMNPIELLKQTITLQAVRVKRGFEAEVNGPGVPLKTLNEATDSLHSMLKTLHELEEGKKLILGVDDSFAALVQRSQIQEEDDW